MGSIVSILSEDPIPPLSDPKSDEPCALILDGISPSWSNHQVSTFLKRLKLRHSRVEKQRGETAAIIYFSHNNERQLAYSFLAGNVLGEMKFVVKPYIVANPPSMPYATESDILKYSSLPINDSYDRIYPYHSSDPDQVLQHKKDRILSYIKDVLPENVDPQITPVPSDCTCHYDVILQIGYDSSGEIAVGYNNASRINTTIQPVDDAFPYPHPILSIAQSFTTFLRSSPFPPYDQHSETGKWRSLHIRITSTSDVLVAVVTNGGLPMNESDRLSKLFDNSVKSVYWVKSVSGIYDYNSISRILCGKSYITEKLDNFTVNVQTFTPLPSNISVFQNVVAEAAKMAKLDAHTVLVDLSCQTGVTCMAFIKYVKRAIGIDVSEHMINTAEKNIEDNKIKKIYVTSGEADQLLPGIASNLPSGERLVCVLCGKFAPKLAVTALQCHRVQGLIYITPTATNLAFDLQRTLRGAMKIEALQLFDIDPDRPDVYTLAYLTRSE